MSDEKNAKCPCANRGCERNRNCAKCQEFHHAKGSKTACGK